MILITSVRDLRAKNVTGVSPSEVLTSHTPVVGHGKKSGVPLAGMASGPNTTMTNRVTPRREVVFEVMAEGAAHWKR